MHKDDIVQLRHVLDAAREAQAFAATRVSTETRLECQEIFWQDIVAKGHRLTHGYYDIDLDIVWSTVTDDLPPLAAELERALTPARRP